MAKRMMRRRGKAECSCMRKGKMGLMMILLGLLILINTYFLYINWGLFFGALLVFAGIIKLIMHKMKRR